MEHATALLLNLTWILFLIVIASILVYAALEMVKQMRSKRLLDEEIYDTMKGYTQNFSNLTRQINQLRIDVDNLGKKVREIESKKYSQGNN
ncbi:MAG TPA: hypothetical protein DDZ60_10275 [Planktothrix sp. UBA10369]|jgi:hypothetical protein|nr:hypothetical protein [Planktothrix sp. UBA10369]